MRIVVPTCNERENLPVLVPLVRHAVPSADLLITDDNSPGGTGLLSRFASLYARTILGLSLRDLTGGFRCWRRRHVLGDLDLGSVRSNGYSFMVETAYRAHLRGHSIVEVSIVFPDRTGGKSKMSKKIILEAVIMVWKLRAQAARIRAAEPSTTRKAV